MSIFRTAYETQACQGMRMAEIRLAIKKAQAFGGISFGDAGFYELKNATAAEIEVPAFAHPLEITEEGAPSVSLALDLRSFGRWDSQQQNFVVRSAAEYELAQTRGVFNLLWLERDPNIFRDMSSFPIQVFVEWVTRNVAKRLALDPREERDLAIHTAFFYLSQFTDDHELSERDRQRCAQLITRSVRGAVVNDAFRVLDIHKGYLHGVKEFCESAQEVTGSVRLAELGVGLLYSLITGSWWSNAREIVGVALEHPPTWITLLYLAINDRAYHSTGLARVVEREGRQEQQQFIKAAGSLYHSAKAPTLSSARFSARMFQAGL